jgi:hypothetical protein
MCNTKFPNEDVFNTLRDRQRASKNKRLDRHRAWREANMSPFLCGNSSTTEEEIDAGRYFRHLQLPDDDHALPLEISAVKIGEGMFVPAGHKIHASVESKDLLVPAQERTRPWQPAGPLAERRSSAAAGLLTVESNHAFRTRHQPKR